MSHRVSPDMHLVEHRVGPGNGGTRGTLPRRVQRGGYHASWHEGRTVSRVGGWGGRWPVATVAEHRLVPAECPTQLACVGVDQQLLGVEAVAAAGVIRSVDAQPVYQAWGRPRQVAMPEVAIARGQWQACHLVHSVGVEQAPFHALRVAREHGQVHTSPVPVGSRWLRCPGRENEGCQAAGVLWENTGDETIAGGRAT